jgi:hypothetical protein
MVVGSISSLIVKLESEYEVHTLMPVCGDPAFGNMILKVTVFMELMFLHTQIISDLELQQSFVLEGKNCVLN